MAGHSHFKSIKHKKAAVDAKRGKAWSKLSRLIIVAARTGGGDPAMNLNLKYAIDDARAANMPKDTIDRAIKKGTGELQGGALDELMYEGYAAGGVAFMISLLTDSRNRTIGEIKTLIEKRGATLGAPGSVAWMFDVRGTVRVQRAKASEDKLMEVVLDAGAEDVRSDGEDFLVVCEPSAFETVRSAIEKAGIPVSQSEITRLPKSTVNVDAETARKIFGLLEDLDDNDDVQKVWCNFEVADEVMAQLEQESI